MRVGSDVGRAGWALRKLWLSSSRVLPGALCTAWPLIEWWASAEVVSWDQETAFKKHFEYLTCVSAMTSGNLTNQSHQTLDFPITSHHVPLCFSYL